MQVWNATTGHRLFASRAQTRPLWAVAWSPDGACVSEASGNTSDELKQETIQVWNATTGQFRVSYSVPSSTTSGGFDGTFSLAWSPNGKQIASGGADTLVHVWPAPSC